MSTLISADRQPELGTQIEELETPVLLVDLDVMESNIQKYVDFANNYDISLRSHIKTHKNPEIAQLQHRMSGGGGIVCQTLGEVEVMARSGLDDIYLSYTVVGEPKLQRLVWLSEKLDQFATTVDHVDNIDPLQRQAASNDAIVDVILEIDVGLHRTGVEPGAPAVELATQIDQAANLSFRGVLAYEANVKAAASTEEEFKRECQNAMDLVATTVQDIESTGVAVPEVKVGGTATSMYSGTHPVVTEINPGMYPFMDVGELNSRPFAVDKSDCAATVLTTVFSKPAADRAVVDAGSKTMSMDKPHMPVPARRSDVEYVNYSEEHGWLRTADPSSAITIGDRIEFIVPHICTTINLHDVMIGVRNGVVVDLFEVAARGKIK